MLIGNSLQSPLSVYGVVTYVLYPCLKAERAPCGNCPVPILEVTEIFPSDKGTASEGVHFVKILEEGVKAVPYRSILRAEGSVRPGGRKPGIRHFVKRNRLILIHPNYAQRGNQLFIVKGDRSMGANLNLTGVPIEHQASSLNFWVALERINQSLKNLCLLLILTVPVTIPCVLASKIATAKSADKIQKFCKIAKISDRLALFPRISTVSRILYRARGWCNLSSSMVSGDLRGQLAHIKRAIVDEHSPSRKCCQLATFLQVLEYQAVKTQKVRNRFKI